MAEPAGLLKASVGEALRFARENLRFTAALAALGAVAVAILSGMRLISPLLGLPSAIFSTVLEAAIYAALTAALLYGAASVRARIGADTGRVWASMAIIAFFLFIVLIVLTIPIIIVLFSGPMAAFVDDIQAAGQDQAAMMQVMAQFATANPGWIAGICLVYALVWLALTSKLYVAAPASLAQQRILTFETWNWTKGAVLRIAGARLMLLTPAYIFVTALTMAIGRVVGIDVFAAEAAEAVARANPALFIAFVLVSSFIQLFIYLPLEAGLSGALYRRLRPENAEVFA